jgi:hypothetical protein
MPCILPITVQNLSRHGRANRCRQRQGGRRGQGCSKAAALAGCRHLSGVTFQGFNRCDGVPAKDLNDLCLLSADDYEARREFIENLMFF